MYLIPLDQMCIFNTMCSRPWGLSKGAEWEFHLRRKKPNRTLKARSDPWHDYSCMTFETFSSTIYQRFDGFLTWIVIVIIL